MLIDPPPELFGGMLHVEPDQPPVQVQVFGPEQTPPKGLQADEQRYVSHVAPDHPAAQEHPLETHIPPLLHGDRH